MVKKKRSDFPGEGSGSQESGASAVRGSQRSPSQQAGGPQGGRAWVPQAPRGGHVGYGGGPGCGMPTQQQYGGPPEYQGRGRGGGAPPCGRSGYRGSARGISGGHEVGPPGGPPRYASVPELYQATQGTYYSGITLQSLPQEAGSSSKSPEQPDIAEQFQQMSIHQTSTSQTIQPASPSSKSMKFPLRPGLGSYGVKCIMKANHFFAELPDKDLHQYDVSINPEVSSRVVNRQVMKKLVDLYKESHLGMWLPTYDGRKSL